MTKIGPSSFPRGDIYEIAKLHLKKKKKTTPEPLGQFQPNLAQSILGCMKRIRVCLKGH